MSLKNIYECDVVIDGVRVGLLARDKVGNVTFSYDQNFVKNGGRSISPHMLTSKIEHNYQGLPPFFSNLLSEGWLKLQHDLAVKIISDQRDNSQDIPVTGFDILAFLGATALRGGMIKSRQRYPQNFWNKLKELKSRMAAGRTILPGYQPKLWVKRDSSGFTVCEPQEATHIAKGEFGSQDEKAHMKNIAINEYLTIQASRALTPNDNIVQAEMADVYELGRCVVIERFDPPVNGLTPRVLDFGQLLDIPPERRMDGTFAQIAQFIAAHADDPPESHYKTDKRDVEIFARRVCRDILIGNYDTHLKNFSLIEQGGIWRLTPDYDLVHTRAYRQCTMSLHVEMPTDRLMQGSTLMAADLRSKMLPSITSFRHGKKLCRLLDSLGLSREIQAGIINDLLGNIPDAEKVINSCVEADQELKNSMLTNLDARRREIFEPALRLCGDASLPKPAEFAEEPHLPASLARTRGSISALTK